MKLSLVYMQVKSSKKCFLTCGLKKKLVFYGFYWPEKINYKLTFGIKIVIVRR